VTHRTPVGHPTAVAAGIAGEGAVGHRRTGYGVVHPAAVVVAEGAVGHGGATIIKVPHPAAEVGGSIADEVAVGHRRAAAIQVEHPAATVVEKVNAVGVAAGDGKALQDGVRAFAAFALDDVIVAGAVDGGHVWPTAAV